MYVCMAVEKQIHTATTKIWANMLHSTCMYAIMRYECATNAIIATKHTYVCTYIRINRYVG